MGCYGAVAARDPPVLRCIWSSTAGPRPLAAVAPALARWAGGALAAVGRSPRPAICVVIEWLLVRALRCVGPLGLVVGFVASACAWASCAQLVRVWPFRRLLWDLLARLPQPGRSRAWRRAWSLRCSPQRRAAGLAAILVLLCLAWWADSARS